MRWTTLVIGFLLGAIISDITRPAVGHCTYSAPVMTDYSKDQIDFARRLREGR